MHIKIGQHELFRSHFPGNPLLPGSLLLDFCRSFIEEHQLLDYPLSELVWRGQFRIPVFPETNIELVLSGKTNHSFRIDVLSNIGVHASISFKRQEIEIILPVPSACSAVKWPSFKKRGFADRINFNDSWKLLDFNRNISIAKYEWRDDPIILLKDFHQGSGFGSIFVLVEMIGESALMTMREKKLIDVDKIFGPVKIEPMWFLPFDPAPHTTIVCITKAKSVTPQIVTWMGEAYENGRLIAQVGGTSTPFIEKKVLR